MYKGIKKKIFLIISTFLIIFILSIFPKKEDKEIIMNKSYVNSNTTIYLIDKNNYVSRVNIYLNENKKEEKIKKIIKYLTIDSEEESYLLDGFKAIIPPKTKLLSLKINKDIVTLNFSKELLKISAENEEKLISALIYSITSIDNINYISIYIDDNLMEYLPHSKQKLPALLDRKFGINITYNINSFKDTTKTTIYYLSKNEDYTYYVPITMVSNNQDEKLSIIIEELSSKSVYQTNLISYLRSSKEIDYKIDDDIVMLNLNNSLFEDLNTSNILETVIYSMNISIKENYDIKKVIYLINDSYYKTYSI